MAHPKRKISKTRRDKRRTHYKIKPEALSTCSVTGEDHRPHRAYWHQGRLYFNGSIVIDNAEEG